MRGTVRCRIAPGSDSAARSPQPPFQFGDTWFGGVGEPPMHYTPRGGFSFGFVLENTTNKPIVITAAHVVAPKHTLIHQIRARFHSWNAPPCNGMCIPYVPFNRSPGAPFTAEPHEGVAVLLSFRFGRCSEITGAKSTPITRFRVGYRTPDGQTHRLVLSLGRAELRLLMPKPEDCARPRSDLRVQGPDRLFTSSENTRPGSVGDVCSIAGGTLSFESRLYLLYARERVYIEIPHFAGKGVYTHAIATLVAPEAGRLPHEHREGAGDHVERPRGLCPHLRWALRAPWREERSVQDRGRDALPRPNRMIGTVPPSALHAAPVT